MGINRIHRDRICDGHASFVRGPKEHIDDILSTAITEELPEFFLVKRNGVFSHPINKGGLWILLERRFTEVGDSQIDSSGDLHTGL